MFRLSLWHWQRVYRPDSGSMGFKCNTVAISIRDNSLYHFSRQMHLREPTDITDEIMNAAMELFRDNYDWSHPIRSLGVRGADLVTADIPVQMSLFMNEEKRAKQEKMDKAVDEIPATVWDISVYSGHYVSRQDIIKAGCTGIPHRSSGRLLCTLALSHDSRMEVMNGIKQGLCRSSCQI